MLDLKSQLWKQSVKLLYSIVPRDCAFANGLRKAYGWLRKPVACIVKWQFNSTIEQILAPAIFEERIRHVSKIVKSDNDKKTFYIIQGFDPNCGLFAFVTLNFAHIAYELGKGYIPVIDMQNSRNIYLEAGKFGIENSWEYFFKQPFEMSLHNIPKGSKCIYSKNIDFTALPIIAYKQQDLRGWLMIYNHFFRLSDRAERYVEKEYHRLIKSDMRVIGVFLRGTDYTYGCPKGHPIQPKIDDVISKVKCVIHEWNCEYIYITTEEKRVVSSFEDVFPGKVLTTKQMYYDEKGDAGISNVEFDREHDAYLRGLEYLTSVIILSRCTSAVVSLAGGSIGAMCINGGNYENIFVFDMGVYP